MFKKIFIVIFSLVFCLTFKSILIYSSSYQEININQNLNDNQDFAADRIIVSMKNDGSSNLKRYSVNDFSEYNCKSIHQISVSSCNTRNADSTYTTFLLKLNNNDKNDVLRLINQLNNRDDVVYAFPDYTIKLSTNNSVSLHDMNTSQSYLENTLKITKFWNYTEGSSDVVVGVIDSGIDGTHEFLEDSIESSLCYNFITGDDSIVHEPVPVDNQIHGTHVAGIIAANYNENVNMSGVCPNVKLASLKVFDSNGEGYISDFLKAIEFATLEKIPILNFSGRWKQDDQDLHACLEDSISKYKGLLICAAGNENRNIDTIPVYPACYNLNNIVCVGSLSSSGYKATDSNYGNNSVDIYARGDDIYSTIPGGYDDLSGTSMATPFVTGVAALLLSFNLNLSSSDIKDILLSSPKDYVIASNLMSNIPLAFYTRDLNAIECLNYIISNYCSNITINVNQQVSYSRELIESTYFTESNIILNVLSINQIETSVLVESTYPIVVELYDENFNIIDIEFNSYNGSRTLSFDYLFDTDIYYMRAYFEDDSVNGTINITFSHEHEYNQRYLWVNNTTHRNMCQCGTFIIEGHAVINGSNICILCNGTAEIGFSGGLGILNSIAYKSLNGSYILENGVIVLVTEDIDLYLNGSLIFYDSSLISKRGILK